MSLWTKKPLGILMAEAGEEGEHTLKRSLSALNLTLLGIGAIIGAGIFVLTGQAAAQYAARPLSSPSSSLASAASLRGSATPSLRR